MLLVIIGGDGSLTARIFAQEFDAFVSVLPERD